MTTQPLPTRETLLAADAVLVLVSLTDGGLHTEEIGGCRQRVVIAFTSPLAVAGFIRARRLGDWVECRAVAVRDLYAICAAVGCGLMIRGRLVLA